MAEWKAMEPILIANYLKAVAWLLAAVYSFRFRKIMRGGSTAWTLIALSCFVIATRQVIKDILLIKAVPVAIYYEFIAIPIAAILWGGAIALIYLNFEVIKEWGRYSAPKIVALIMVLVFVATMTFNGIHAAETVERYDIGEIAKIRADVPTRSLSNALWFISFALTIVVLEFVLLGERGLPGYEVIGVAFRVLILASILGLIWKGWGLYIDNMHIKLPLMWDVVKKMTEVCTACAIAISMFLISKKIRAYNKTTP